MWPSRALVLSFIVLHYRYIEGKCSDVVVPSNLSGWPWWTEPSQAGIHKERLLNGLASLDERGYRPAIFASRCGKVFYSSGNVSQSLPVYSIGKTVVTTLAGILLVKENSTSLDDLLPLSNNPTLAEQACSVNPTWNFNSGSIGGPLRSLRSFLSMTSAFGLGVETTPTASSMNVAAYSNNAIEFLWACHVRTILARQNAIKSDLDAVRTLWNTHLNGHEDEILIHEDSQISGYGPSGGLHISARDVARLGLLYLSLDGSFGNRSILAPHYVADATVPQVPQTARPSQRFSNNSLWNIRELSIALPFDTCGHEGTRMRGAVGYGFGLWILKHSGTFHLSGQGGNYVIVDQHSGFVISVLHGKSRYPHPNAIDYLDAFRNAIVLAQND